MRFNMTVNETSLCFSQHSGKKEKKTWDTKKCDDYFFFFFTSQVITITHVIRQILKSLTDTFKIVIANIHSHT